jgi:hypothetical protein
MSRPPAVRNLRGENIRLVINVERAYHEETYVFFFHEFTRIFTKKCLMRTSCGFSWTAPRRGKQLRYRERIRAETQLLLSFDSCSATNGNSMQEDPLFANCAEITVTTTVAVGLETDLRAGWLACAVLDRARAIERQP